jgi:hypothetical protein
VLLLLLLQRVRLKLQVQQLIQRVHLLLTRVLVQHRKVPLGLGLEL